MKTDLVIIGGGPAGMAAAVSAYENGTTDILILERVILIHMQEALNISTMLNHNCIYLIQQMESSRSIQTI